jgi:hypothetical protein
MCVLVDMHSIAVNAFPHSCQIFRKWRVVVIDLNNQQKRSETRSDKRKKSNQSQKLKKTKRNRAERMKAE